MGLEPLDADHRAPDADDLGWLSGLATRALDPAVDDDAACIEAETRRLATLLGCPVWLHWRGTDEAGRPRLRAGEGLAAAHRAGLAALARLDGPCGEAVARRVPVVADDLSTLVPSDERDAWRACGLRGVAAVAVAGADDASTVVVAFASPGPLAEPGLAQRRLSAFAAVLQAGLARRRRDRDQAAAVDRLLQARHHQSLAIDSLPGVVYDWDLLTGRIERAGALPARLGYRPDEVEPGPAWWQARVHPDDLAAAGAAYQATVERGGDAVDLQYRLRRADGGWLWVWERARLLRDADGRVVRAVGTTIDIDAQRRAEISLREGTQRLRMALDASFSVVFDWDLVADEVRRPFSTQSALPVTEPERPARFEDVVAAVHPQDREAFRAVVRAAVADPAAGYRNEYRLVLPDGSQRWMREVAHLECDADGRAVRMIGLSQDVTASAEATRRLQASEARHAFLLRLGDLLRPLADPLEIQRTACRALGEHLGACRVGYAEDAGDGDSVVVRSHHAVPRVPAFDGRLPLAIFGERLVGAFRSGRTVVVPDTATDPGVDDPGRETLVRAAIGAMIDVPLVKQDRLRAVLFVHQETARTWTRDEVDLVTQTAERLWSTVERAQAEARLADERSVLDAVLATAPAGFAVFDRELRFRLINPRLADMNGLPVQAHIGRTVGEVVPSLLEQARMVVDRVFATGTAIPDHEFSGETALAPGVQRRWRESWYPVKGADGDVRAVAVMVEEITERRRMEREREDLIAALKAADRRKDEFLAMLAHELRNPLAPIRHAVEVLRRPGLELAQSDRMHATIARQVTHLSRLVDDLLDASRVTQGKITLDRRPVDLAVVAYTGVEQARPLIDARGHHLVLVLPPPGRAWVDADPARLAQVIGNLLGNAAKYTDPGGHITLTVELDAGEAVVRVEDDGMGITGEMLPAVFDLFTQADRSLDRAQGGLGIGLALVRSLVTMHGGTVQAESAGAGRGSRFTVRLPQGVPPQAPAAVADEPPARGGLRVLVVDDNVDAAETLALLLGLYGCVVHVAHDGGAALAAAPAFAPAVCLLDIGLPDMDGYQLARRLREQPATASARLVALTGYGRDEDKRRATEAGFDAHLTKPVEPDTLLAAIGAGATEPAAG